MAHYTDRFENDVSDKPILSGPTSTYTESKDDPFNATEVLYTDESSYIEMVDICHMPPHPDRNRPANGEFENLAKYCVVFALYLLKLNSAPSSTCKCS
jgi:hypothetical protein